MALGPTPTRAHLGAAIRQVRLGRNLSQEALAAATGLHRTYVGSVERGERNPSFDNIVKIARALNIRASGLIAAAENLATA